MHGIQGKILRIGKLFLAGDAQFLDLMGGHKYALAGFSKLDFAVAEGFLGFFQLFAYGGVMLCKVRHPLYHARCGIDYLLLVVDLLYGVLDPRIRVSAKGEEA